MAWRTTSFLRPLAVATARAAKAADTTRIAAATVVHAQAVAIAVDRAVVTEAVAAAVVADAAVAGAEVAQAAEAVAAAVAAAADARLTTLAPRASMA